MQMMEHIHLAGEDEDELYSGFNDYDATLDTDELQNDAGFQQAVKTSHGRRPPPTAARIGTMAGGRKNVMPPSSMGRPITGSVDGAARPMTAVRAAGYRGASFDPMGQGAKGPAPPLEQKSDDSPEEKIKALEKKVNELIEESCFANSRGELQLALEKAKDAGRKERMLVRQREQLSTTEQINLDLTYIGLDKAKEAGRKERILVKQREQVTSGEQVNLDLTYSVLFNLANQYAANEMYAEALNTYQVIVKNKMFSNAGRLKVNMGNIYFKQKNYPKAIKFYRMALDQVPNTHRSMRLKIMSNIGIVFTKMGQYNDAITSFEHIMQEEADFKTGFNLILCYFALGDRDKMKRAFQKLLTVDLKIDDEEKYTTTTDDKQSNLVLEVIKNDTLRKIEREKKSQAERCIKTAAKIISPAVENTFAAGYDWCMDQVKSSSYLELAHDLEIDKAIGFLKKKDFQEAIETLKSFEKKDTKVACTAATNLSFLYFLSGEENEQSLADRYADTALRADRYNPSALVNKGNVLYQKGDYEKAREYYREALNNDSSCVEGLYNLGLSNKRLRRYEDALDSFYKLHAILRNSAQVIYQIGDIYDNMGESAQATEWFLQLLGIVPTDAAILERLGQMCAAEGDMSQAYQYHFDSYRYNPCNLAVIEWLGSYYIDSQFCEKAIHYFERAAIIQPSQIKWHLMVASCHRRSGNYQQALDTYKHIHKKFPDNIECLRFLSRLCTDLGLKEAQDYENKLKKAEKAAKMREERINSGSRRGSGRHRQTSAGSHARDRPGSDTSSDSREGMSRQSSGRGSANRRTVNLDDTDEPYQMSNRQEVDTTYSDPLGPQAERPKTAARRRDMEDEWENEELGDDLLPE